MAQYVWGGCVQVTATIFLRRRRLVLLNAYSRPLEAVANMVEIEAPDSRDHIPLRGLSPRLLALNC
jgi:hypothetical protein